MKHRYDILRSIKKIPEKTKGVTIDALAIMVAKGFESVYKRFDAMDKKFSDKFEEVDSRFDTLETVVYKIDSKVDSIDKKLKKVDESADSELVNSRLGRRLLAIKRSAIDAELQYHPKKDSRVQPKSIPSGEKSWGHRIILTIGYSIAHLPSATPLSP